MDTPLLKVDDVKAGYGDVTVLWGVSFEIAPGETVCLVGSNGAGKSTLLSTISGLIKPSNGTIQFKGRDITQATPQAILAAGIAHVPEGRRLFGPMNVQDNLLMGAYLRTDTDEIKRDLDRMFTL